jgi:hypothetical protein
MGNPGIAVPNNPLSDDSYSGELNMPPRDGGRSNSTLNVGTSDCAGVSETSGGAGFDAAGASGGLSELLDLLEVKLPELI